MTSSHPKADRAVNARFADLNPTSPVRTLSRPAAANADPVKALHYYDRTLQLRPGPLKATQWRALDVAGLSDHKPVVVAFELDTDVAAPVARFTGATLDEVNTYAKQHSSKRGDVYKIVLTGGPCGGKSSAMAKLRCRLQKLGFQVLVVSETATEVFKGSGGFDPSWAGTAKERELQKTLIRAQLAREDVFESMAKLREPMPAVMLCDRGTLDGEAFCPPEHWTEALHDMGVTKQELYDNYDCTWSNSLSRRCARSYFRGRNMHSAYLPRGRAGHFPLHRMQDAGVFPVHQHQIACTYANICCFGDAVLPRQRCAALGDGGQVRRG